MKNISYNTLKNKCYFMNYQSFALFLIYIAVIAALCYRALFGVEMTDEALYIAEGFLITNGATPYVDMWLHCSGFALLNAPFIWLYTLISGSTTGLVLYFRITSIFIKIVFVCLSIYILRPIIKPKITALWLLPFLAFVPHSIISMSYNTWSFTLLFLASISISRAILSEEERCKLIFGIVAGISSALAILCYPTVLISASTLLFISIIYERIQSNKHKVSLGYLIGGLSTALIISLFFLIHSKETFGIYEGLKIIVFDNPYHELSKNITKDTIVVMFNYFKSWFWWLLISYAFISIPILNKRQKTTVIISYVLIYIIYQSYLIFLDYDLFFKTNNLRGLIENNIPRLIFPIPLILYSFINDHKERGSVLLFFIYLPAFTHSISTSFLVFNGMNNRYYLLIQGSLLSIPYIYWAVREITKYKIISKTISFLSTLAISVTITGVFLLSYFAYVYRDAPIAKLDYKVEFGIYKSLYTTKEKGKGLEVLEKIIRTETNSNEKILFMDTVPMAYLMTDSKHCSPSSWELQQYSYGFNEDTLLRKYFERTGCTPDKIIYIFTGRDKILSIDSEGYKFNNYVNANYKLTSDIDAYYPVKIYERIAK